jgi:outer membrane receptor protein involved in Fe transport
MRITRNSPLFLATLSACFFSLAARAENIKIAARDIETVIVTATRSTTRLEEMPLYTTLLTQEDVDKSPAQTLDQLLRNVPGMNFTGVPAALSDPTGHQTRMRGLGNAKVLVLLDGVPIHDPFYITTQWYKVPLSTIDRVEVLRGGNSSLWGNLAVAGVVNIITRRPEIGRGNEGEFRASVGSFGTRNLSFSKSWAASEALGFNLSADVMQTEGYQVTPSGDLWRFPNKRPTQATDRNIQFTTYIKPSSDLDGWLRLGYHVQDQLISYSVGSNVQKSPDIAGGVTWRLNDGSSLAANGWAQYVNFEKYNGNACYYQGGTSCLTSTAATLTPSRVNGNALTFYTQYGSQRYREQGGSLVYSKPMPGLVKSLQIGADIRHLSAVDSEVFYGTPTNPGAPQGALGSFTYGRGEQAFKGLFGQVRISPVDPLEITFSVRADNWRNDKRFNTRTTAAGVRTGGALQETTKSAVSPSFAARYEITADWNVRGAAYKAFRAPGFNNITRTFGSPNPTIANPFLEPEKLNGWELGTDWRIGPFSAEATYFRYDIRNMIATYRVTSAATAPDLVKTICGATLANCAGSASFYTNDQDGQSKGVELAATWRMSESLSMEAAWTHTDSMLTRHGSIVTDPVNVQLVAIPKNTGSLSATWHPVEGLRAYAELRYIGPMLLDTTSNASTMRHGQGGVSVMNVSASYVLNARHELTLSVVNLFNREYSENNYSFNQPYNRTLSSPQSVNLGLKVKF